MCVLFKNKKGINEVISFVLLTLLIVFSCTSTYVIAKNVINDKVSEIDLSNAEIYMQKIKEKTNEIQNFDGSSFGISVKFNTGKLRFNSNQMSYQSFVKYTGDTYCFDGVCHESNNDYEVIYINLSNSYAFDETFTLNKGNYLLLFKNIKNEKEIQITFK